MLAASVTSSETASTASPSRARARAAASPFAGSREARSTRIPLSESWRQTSKPMPRLAPVTRAIGDDGRMARASAADRLNRGAGVGGRFPDRTPALEFGGEGGLFLFPGADRIRAEHEAQRRIVAFDRGDHGLRRPGGIAGLLAVAAIEVGFEGIDERPVGVETALGPHVDRACELGPERAGLDDRHADAEGPHLVPQRLAPAFQREFRRAVGAESADGKESADAGELEDVSACLRAHRGQHETRHLGGREKVDLHLFAQLLRRKLLDRAERAAPRDVGQDVDAPETVKRGFDGCLARLRVRDVEPDGKRRLRIWGRHRFEGRDPARRKDAPSPRRRTASASARPKPLEAPVMNQSRCIVASNILRRVILRGLSRKMRRCSDLSSGSTHHERVDLIKFTEISKRSVDRSNVSWLLIVPHSTSRPSTKKSCALLLVVSTASSLADSPGLSLIFRASTIRRVTSSWTAKMSLSSRSKRSAQRCPPVSASISCAVIRTRAPARRMLPSSTERTPSSRATTRMSTDLPL